MKHFSMPTETTVVTSKYVTAEGLPILYVSHDFDEEEGDSWQFHCGNGDFDMEKMQLVRLSTILQLDKTVEQVSDLPVGFAAKRKSIGEPWVYEKEG
jgi:hypothetical protein